MTFAQRLVTLMNLFKISSSELAHGINVDASLISRWKTGERKIPANSPHIYNIVIYFQGLKAHDYQKNYLERIISTYLSGDDRQDGAKRTYALIKWLVSECPAERNAIDNNPIFENSPFGIAINRNGRILYANQVYVDIFGYSNVKELQGKNIIDQVAPDGRGKIVQLIQQREQNRFMPLTVYEIDGFRKDGTIFPILVEVKNVNLPDGPAFAAYISDLTDQKYLEEKLSRQVKLQELILDISKSFTRAAIDDLDSLIADALMRIGSFDNDDRSFIYIYSDSKGSITNTYEWCAEGISYERSGLQEIDVSGLPWSQENILQQECICIPQVSDLPENAASEKDFIAARGVQSIIAVPMIYDSKLIGYLGFDSIRRTKIWSEEAIMMLESVAQIITNGLIQKKYVLSLCESENYYRTIFNTGEAKLIVDENSCISLVNFEFSAISGYARKDLEGTKWSSYVCDDVRDIMNKYWEQQKINPDLAPKKYCTKIKAKHGKELIVLLSANAISGTSKMLITLTNLTEINRINRALEAINACDWAIIRAHNELELINNICRIIVEKGGYHFAWVGFAENDEKQTLRPIACAGFESGYLNQLDIALSDSGWSNCPAVKAIQSGHIFVCKNIEADMESSLWKNIAAECGYKAVACIPFHIAIHDTSAFVSIYSQDTASFDEKEVDLLTNMAASLAYGIESLRMAKERNIATDNLKKSLKNRHKMLLQTVSAFATVVDIRDPYTSGHQKNVTNLSVILALDLGLPEEELEEVFVAAALHDIGKISVPNEILCKPGKLTKLEFEIIKGHCQTGFDIVKEIEFPWPVAEIISQHHERLDGTGYPKGLTGEEIHLAARIIAVADTVEAMASHRPYRAALGIDRALEEISKQKSIKFDPEVVDACVRLFRDKGYVIPTF